jgi:perosamine synthetase
MANEHNLALVVDAAHALGCQTTGDNASVPWGDAACFSLGRGKLVSGGEGGFLATDDESLYERVLLLTQHASRITRELGPGLGVCGELGLNYRMHPLAAVLALADLDVMRARLTHRRAVWQAFHDGLGCVPELMPVPRGKETAAWTAYGLPLTCLAKGKDCAVEREHLLDLANQSALPLRSGPVSIPLHLRLKTHRLPVTPHPTHSPGFCPVAEERCATKELWMLSALDMDGMSVKEVRSIGERLRELCSK